MDETTAATDQPIAPITFKKRTAKAKAQFRKKEPSPPPASSDSDSDFTSDEEEGRTIKRRRKNATVTASSTATVRREPGEDAKPLERPSLPTGNDATKHSNWYDEGKDDELSAKNLLGTTRAQSGTATPSEPDGKYRGAANYTSFIQKNPNAPSKQVGPIKAPTNIRTVTMMDYAPDVCKDYKLTGFCGFGDTCKFAHQREDYRQGWELDREWEIQTKGKKLEGRVVASIHRNAQPDEEDDDEDDELLESIPFACFICKGPYNNPIVTRCGHYFCESCALQRYRKNPSCAACGAGTGGVFNTAKKLNKLLERKRERARKRRQRAIEAGEEVSDEEDEEEPEVAGSPE
ncbi:hypothetical protein VTO42DRAFT_6838 [Malbranchea cinnamomea]